MSSLTLTRRTVPGSNDIAVTCTCGQCITVRLMRINNANAARIAILADPEIQIDRAELKKKTKCIDHRAL